MFDRSCIIFHNIHGCSGMFSNNTLFLSCSQTFKTIPEHFANFQNVPGCYGLLWNVLEYFRWFGIALEIFRGRKGVPYKWKRETSSRMVEQRATPPCNPVVRSGIPFWVLTTRILYAFFYNRLIINEFYFPVIVILS